jgi:hypothetical protein
MHANRGGVPAPGLPRALLHVEELAPAKGLAVPPAEAVRVEPGADRLLAHDRVLERRHERTELLEERSRLGPS